VRPRARTDTLRDAPALLSEVRVGFRLIGDEVDPEVVAQEVALAPTEAHRKGDPRPTRWGARGLRWPTGVWRLESELPASASLEEHLRALLDRLDPVAAGIRRCTARGWRADYFCGCFQADMNEGTDLAPETLGRIAALGAILSLDIYSGTEEAAPDRLTRCLSRRRSRTPVTVG
jgi:Domain of unknown function (DUF4279)